jgi:adenosylhomocysteine nucleosidase
MDKDDYNNVPLIIGAFDDEIKNIKIKMKLLRTVKLTYGRLYLGEINVEKVMLLKSGVGLMKAAKTLKETLDIYIPSIIISYGTAGKISPNMKIGNIILADSLIVEETEENIDIECHMLNMAKKWLANLKCKYFLGTIISSTRLIENSNERDEFFLKYNASIVDMESGALAKISNDYQIPFICIRIVSDNADSSLKKLDVLKETSKTNTKTIINVFSKKPWIIPFYIKFMLDIKLSVKKISRLVLDCLNSWNQKANENKRSQ